MDHAAASARLSAYIDSELAPELRASLESHLAACPACSAELRTLQQTSALLQKLPAPAASAALLARLHTAVDTTTRRPLERFVGLLSGIAACLAVMGGLLLLRPAAAATAPAAWESSAVQLSEDSAATPNSASPENAIGQWMVASLSSHGTAEVDK